MDSIDLKYETVWKGSISIQNILGGGTWIEVNSNFSRGRIHIDKNGKLIHRLAEKIYNIYLTEQEGKEYEDIPHIEIFPTLESYNCRTKDCFEYAEFTNFKTLKCSKHTPKSSENPEAIDDAWVMLPTRYFHGSEKNRDLIDFTKNGVKCDIKNFLTELNLADTENNSLNAVGLRDLLLEKLKSL